MEGNNNNNNNYHNKCEVCGSGSNHCGRCGNMCGFSGYHILRWVLGILIITWIFSIGMRFGELKARLEGYDGYGYRNERVMPMMGGAWNGGDAVYYTQSSATVPNMMTGIKGGSVQVIKGN